MKITKNDFCYFTTEQDLTFGEQITLDGELLIPISTLDKIRAEIEEIEKNYGLDKATKYGNKNAEQQNLSYSTMMMYEVADITDEIKDIIDRDKRYYRQIQGR